MGIILVKHPLKGECGQYPKNDQHQYLDQHATNIMKVFHQKATNSDIYRIWPFPKHI